MLCCCLLETLCARLFACSNVDLVLFQLQQSRFLLLLAIEVSLWSTSLFVLIIKKLSSQYCGCFPSLRGDLVDLLLLG